MSANSPVHIRQEAKLHAKHNAQENITHRSQAQRNVTALSLLRFLGAAIGTVQELVQFVLHLRGEF